MAWYYGEYSCGHEGRVNVVGPGESRQWIVDRKFEGLCPDCYKIKLAEDREKKYEESKKASEEMELPELEGSEKQIQWAMSIRIDAIKSMIETIDIVFKKDGTINMTRNDKVFQIRKSDAALAMEEGLKNKISARFWIDNRSNFDNLLLIFIKLHIDTDKIFEEEQKNLTVEPEDLQKPGVVHIKYSGSNLSAEYIKDDDFMKIVKSLKFEWHGVWEKSISEFTGSIEDREAELGNALLAAGFTVEFTCEESKEKAVSGSFEPECDRWVMYSTKKNKLIINWYERNNTLYESAKRISGAKWDNGMQIPLEFYDEVLDFAETYKFQLSNKAKKKINEYAEVKINFEKTSVQKVNERAYDDYGALEKQLKHSGVIEDLIDEIE